MPSDIALQIQTQYDGSGMDKATKSVQGFQDQVNTAAKTTGVNLEGLFRRIERPLGMIAFSGVAQELVGMGQKGESAGIMIERAMHAAGSALMFFNPLAGITVIAGTALFEVFQKISASSKLTKEDLEKLFDANNKTAESFKAAAEEAKKMGERPDVIKSLEDQGKALESVTSHTKDNAKAQMEAARADLNRLLAQRELGRSNLQQAMDDELNTARKKKIKDAQDRLTESIKTYTAVLADDATAQSKDLTWMTEIAAAKDKLAAKTMNLVQVKAKEAELDQKLTVLEQEMARDTTQAQVEATQKKIDALNKELQVYQQVAAKEQEASNKLAEDIRKTGEAVKGMTEGITRALIEGASGTKSAMAAIGKIMVESMAKAATQVLEIDAAKNFAIPGMQGVALAEEAAIGVINGIAGAIGGSGGGASSGASSATATGQNNVTTPNSSSSGQTQPTLLQINVQGGVIDDAFAATLAKRLSDVVGQNGVTLLASGVSYS